jgi:hypothetical protein
MIRKVLILRDIFFKVFIIKELGPALAGPALLHLYFYYTKLTKLHT